jgi:hypothetical protein
MALKKMKSIGRREYTYASLRKFMRVGQWFVNLSQACDLSLKAEQPRTNALVIGLMT